MKANRLSITRGHVSKFNAFSGNSGAALTVVADRNDGMSGTRYYRFKTFDRKLVDKLVAEGWGSGDFVTVIAGDKLPGGKNPKGGFYPDDELIVEIQRIRQAGSPVAAEDVQVLKGLLAK